MELMVCMYVYADYQLYIALCVQRPSLSNGQVKYIEGPGAVYEKKEFIRNEEVEEE
jgi:hypothetical protein